MILRNLHTLAVSAIVALPIFFNCEVSFAKRAAEGDAQHVEQELPKNRVTSSSSSSAFSDSLKGGSSSSSSSDRKSSGSSLDSSKDLKQSASRSSSSSEALDDTKKLIDPNNLSLQQRSTNSSSSSSSSQDPRSSADLANKSRQSKSTSSSSSSSVHDNVNKSAVNIVFLQAKFNLDEGNGNESVDAVNARELRVRYLSKGERFRLEAQAENFAVGTKFEVLIGDVSIGILTVEQSIEGAEGKIEISERNKPADLTLNITEGTIVKFVDEAGVVVAEGPMVSRR